MQHQMQRDNSDMDINGHRPQSPASIENAPSPSKRQRLEGGQFNGQMGPNGRGQPQGMPQSQQQANAMLMKSGINPNNLTASQFQSFQSQNPQVQAKSIQVYAQNLAQHHNRSAMNNQGIPNGMMNSGIMPGQGSPMMQPVPDGAGLAVPMNEYYAGNPQLGAQMARAGMPNPAAGQGGNHALQDYQMQLMLLEQQNKKRLMMARQEQDSMTRTDGQPGMAGQPGLPPGMSPQGSRGGGPSPNPSDQMKRGTPKMGQAGLPGSPTPGDGMAPGRGSPAAMNFNGQMPPDMNQFFQLNKMGDGMAAPPGTGMRPPSSNPNFPPQMQMEMARQQQAGRLPSGNWQPGAQGQPMMQGPPQGQPQGMGTPQERNTMPPPQAPPAGANAGRTQPSSPQPGAATPQQSNKANPKGKKGDTKEPRKVIYPISLTSTLSNVYSDQQRKDRPPTLIPQRHHHQKLSIRPRPRHLHLSLLSIPILSTTSRKARTLSMRAQPNLPHLLQMHRCPSNSSRIRIKADHLATSVFQT